MLTQEQIRQEAERRANSWSLRLRALSIFARFTNFTVALTFAPLALSILALVLGFGYIFVQCLLHMDIFAQDILKLHAHWFMPIWYTTWHLFFVMLLATVGLLVLIVPKVILKIFGLIWSIPQFFFWEGILPGRDWRVTDAAIRAGVKDEIDQAAIQIIYERRSIKSRPSFAKIIFNLTILGYCAWTYNHFYVLINHTTGHYFAWGLNSWHP